MVTINEGEKRWIKFQVERLIGSGSLARYQSIDLTVPQRRILTAARATISGLDWGTAAYDSAKGQISAFFDSTVTALQTPATYIVQVRGVIDGELYAAEEEVVVEDWGS